MYFVKVPTKLFELNLTPAEFFVLCVLLSHDLTQFSPSIPQMVKKGDWSTNTIRRALQSLKNRGLVKITKKELKYGYVVNQYEIVLK